MQITVVNPTQDETRVDLVHTTILIPLPQEYSYLHPLIAIREIPINQESR